MQIQRRGKVLPGYHADVLGEEVANSSEFNSSCVYTLPKRLIDIVREQQPNFFSAEQIQKELQFAENPLVVVFDKGMAKTAKLLQKYDATTDEHSYKEMFGEKPYRAMVQAIDGDLRKIDQIGKAYCGWLAQQSAFQVEIEALRESLRTRQGDSSDIQADPVQLSGGDSSEKNESMRTKICKKWRLSYLITTEIPDPLLPHFSAINFYSKDAPEGAVVPFIPDTFPIPGTGFAVNQLNNSRKTSDAIHLSDWWDLTANDIGNTRPFELLARQYQLQHYWRVLKTRFPKETNRKQQVFSHIFASYFDVSQDTIRRDFQQLKKKSDLLDKPIELHF